jgi:acyl-CoA hydrolase
VNKTDIYKTPKDSSVESRYLVMPENANHLGSVFGGTIMSWIDLIAAMVAQRHAETQVVTLSIDRLTFINPIFVGDQVVLKASVNYTGNSTMEIGVQVTKENPITKESLRATTAYLTFVALDGDRKPVKVPRIKPETEKEVNRYENAKIRQASLKELKARLKH